MTGTEIKSIRGGKVSIKEAYAKIIDGEVLILGMNISPYEQGNRFNVDPLRPRKLLLHRREINKLIGKIKVGGVTLIPLRVYLNDKGRAKIEIAVARGKKLYDKRDSIAKRDTDRKIQRTMKKQV